MKKISRRIIINYLSGLLGYFFLIRATPEVKAKEARLFNNPQKQDNLNQKIIQESGDFVSEVNRLKKLAFKKDSKLYLTPTASQLSEFSQLAKALIAEDFERGVMLARKLDYEVVKFIDTPSQTIFYGVREKLIRGKQTLGWGSYFINPAYLTNVLVEVPHVLYDRYTEDIGANVFLKASARGFLLAGAHRHANGIDTADVCDPIASVFQEVHKAWVSSNASAWQIHGFNLENHVRFPANTEVVLSDGRGQIVPEILNLSKILQKANYHAYAYNHLAANNYLNQQVNRGIEGSIFSPLGATQNVQGIYSRDRQQAFIHIEIERHIRESQFDRKKIADCIADSILALSISH